MIKSLHKIISRIHKLYPNITVEDYRGCIRLSGELDNWSDIVEAGSMAVCPQSLGVLNDIKLKGFSEPIHSPVLQDDKLDGNRPDVLIIGAGVIGCAIARELSRYDISVLIVEKENDIAMAQSSRNDGDVHVGIDLSPKQVKHRYNARGNAMFERLAEELSLDFQRTGHMIIFSRWYERLLVPILKLRAKQLCIPNTHYVSKKELSKIESGAPSWNRGAFFMPSGGEICPYKFTLALAENAVSNGVKLELNTIVQSILVENDCIKSVKTNRGTIYPQVVINAAGVYSDVVADMAGDRTFTIHPRKGTVLILDKKKAELAHTSMNKSPFVKEKGASTGKHTKGGGVVHTVDGNVLIGPSAEEQPFREDVSTEASMVDAVFQKQKNVAEQMSKGDVITYFAGVRACNYEEDFVVRKGIFTKNIVEAASIQSPGLTAAPAIAVDVSEWAVDMLDGAKENFSFNPIRKPLPELRKLSIEQRDELIRINPDYGIIICRCEEISKGEIIDAINSPVPATTLDGVKRRVRAGMGRCQGGFCSPLVAKLLSERLGIPLEKVNKSTADSPIVFGDTKGAKNGMV